METVIKLKCPCGQITEIVKRGRAYYYARRHGTERVYDGCINCHNYLPTPDDQAAQQAKTEQSAKGPPQQTGGNEKVSQESEPAKKTRPSNKRRRRSAKSGK